MRISTTLSRQSRFRPKTTCTIIRRELTAALSCLGLGPGRRRAKGLSLNTSGGSIYDFHEVAFLPHSGILRIQPVLQTEAIAVNIADNVDLRYSARAAREHRWKRHTQHRNSLLRPHVDARQPVMSFACGWSLNLLPSPMKSGVIFQRLNSISRSEPKTLATSVRSEA